MQKSTLLLKARETTRLAKTVHIVEGMLAEIVAELIDSCMEMGKDLLGWQQQEWEDLFSGKRIRIEETGRDLKEAYRDTLDRFEETASKIQDCQGRGSRIAGAEEFHRLHEKIKRLAGDFDRRWPRFDPVALQQAIDRIDAGQYLTPEEFRSSLSSED
jgi:hypothetical protein